MLYLPCSLSSAILPLTDAVSITAGAAAQEVILLLQVVLGLEPRWCLSAGLNVLRVC